MAFDGPAGPAAEPPKADMLRVLKGFQRWGNLAHFPLCKPWWLCYTQPVREDRFASFLGSSAVEHSTVNRMVAGSNPARGASRLFRQHSRLFAPSSNPSKSSAKLSTSWHL